MSEINFSWDPLSDNILQERDETGAVTAEYTAEPGLYGNVISQNRGRVESQFHYDAQGSTLALTDDNQNVTDTFAYTAFGEVTERTGTTEVPFQYIGQKGYYSDTATGQISSRRRIYAPSRSRWISTDPFPSSAAQLNAFRYVVNRPTRLIDPSGLEELKCKCDERLMSVGPVVLATKILDVELDKNYGGISDDGTFIKLKDPKVDEDGGIRVLFQQEQWAVKCCISTSGAIRLLDSKQNEDAAFSSVRSVTVASPPGPATSANALKLAKCAYPVSVWVFSCTQTIAADDPKQPDSCRCLRQKYAVEFAKTNILKNTAIPDDAE